MIELKHVSKSYTTGVDALKDINLTIMHKHAGKTYLRGGNHQWKGYDQTFHLGTPG